jgi:hypothetical protein
MSFAQYGIRPASQRKTPFFSILTHNGNGLRRRYVIARAEFWQRFCLKTPDQSKNKTITLPMHDRTVTFKGLPYLFDFVLPNVYFYVATAYDSAA